MREGVSAKDAGPAPSCECHDQPMRWNKRRDLRAGGFWFCRVKSDAATRRARDADPERYRAMNAAWRAANGSRIRAYQRRYRYGIKAEEYDALWAAQKGRCALCDIPAADAPKGALHVDHDHQTGRVRGLLCLRCNSTLERVELSGWLQSAVDYLGLW